MWFAILAAALVFGALHLPAMRGLVPLTGVVAARTVTLNAIGGVVFGWLYWKYSLGAAMTAHGAADLVLRGAAPRRGIAGAPKKDQGVS
jgi:membrane protease YdiL (CAAX protease family)